MVSAKQVAANKRNAAKSTGPRTEEGKARSRMNALRHGLAAKQPDNHLGCEGGALALEKALVRLHRAETQQLKRLYTLHHSVTEGSRRDVETDLQHLEVLNRYIMRAHAMLKKCKD